MAVVTFEQVRQDPEVHAYIVKANEMLSAIGFTEHGLRHVGLVAQRAMVVMAELKRPERMRELAGIAALLHDIGNLVNRNDHGQTSALLAHSILSRMGMPPDEIGRASCRERV